MYCFTRKTLVGANRVRIQLLRVKQIVLRVKPFESNCNPARTLNCIWSKASIDDIKQYQLVLDNKLQLIDINNSAYSCTNWNCQCTQHFVVSS